MRVLLINTSERIGGAAVAASRLMESLKNNGIKAKLLVRDKQTDQITVVSLNYNWRMIWKFVWERIVIWKANRFKKENIFAVDIANTGTDITSLPEFQQADVIHLHWINQGMLSLKNIEKILASGKPVVWTMHDMWPCTGICHHARECTRYQQECGNCPFIHGNGSRKDLSYRTFRKKQELYQGRHINFVTCSHWLEGLAKKSALLAGHTITCIPNPINTNLFKPHNKQEARNRCQLPQDARLVLFGSVKTTDKRKGIDYLVESCALLAEKHPELKTELGVVVFRQRVAATGQLAAFQGLSAGLCEQRTPVGKHIQCGRPLRHPFAGREPAQHDYGSHGMRHSLRRLQRGRHSRNDRPPAQRIRGAIQVVRGFCQRHLLDTDRPGLSQPRRAGLPEGRHPLFGKRHRQEIY